MPEKIVALDRKVPDFSLPATGGKPWKLSSLAGRNVVVYFYPRDNTSGCTKEGMDFRDLYPQFRKAKTEAKRALHAGQRARIWPAHCGHSTGSSASHSSK